jgi:hypothetical protein
MKKVKFDGYRCALAASPPAIIALQGGMKQNSELGYSFRM